MKQEKSKLSKKIDSICRALFLTEEGKPKSAALLYSFCLGLLFFGLYLGTDIACVFFLTDLFPQEAVWWATIIQYSLQGIVAGLICVCLVFCFKELDNKKLVPSAFSWLIGLTLIISVMMLFFCDYSEGFGEGMLEYWLFLKILIIPWAVFLTIGTLGARWLVKRAMAKDAEKKQMMPKRPSYYNT